MIYITRVTHEDAILKSLQDDERSAGRILSAADGDVVQVRFVYVCDVPAKYAKAVLADHIKNKDPHA